MSNIIEYYPNCSDVFLNMINKKKIFKKYNIEDSIENACKKYGYVNILSNILNYKLRSDHVISCVALIAANNYLVEILEMIFSLGLKFGIEDYKTVLKILLKNKKFELVNVLFFRYRELIDENYSLYIFSKYGHLEIVKLMIDTVNFTDTEWFGAALIKACKHGHLEIVNLLLKNPLTDPSIQSNLPLIEACKYGHFEIVKLLLGLKDVNPMIINRYSAPTLFSNKYTKIIKLLIEDGRILQNNTILIDACSYGLYCIVEILVEKYEFSPNIDNDISLKMACFNGHANVVEFLLKDGRSDPSVYNNCCITGASKNGHNKVVELLLYDKRVDPTAVRNLSIRNAALYGHIEIVKLLLSDKRVDPSDGNGDSVMASIKYGYGNILKLLLEDNRIKYYKYYESMILLAKKCLNNNAISIIKSSCKWYKIYLYIKYGNKLVRLYRKLIIKWSEPEEFLYKKCHKRFKKLLSNLDK